MYVLNSFSSGQAYGLLSPTERHERTANQAEEIGFGNRNTGPDTVTVSNEALQKFLDMKSGNGSGSTEAEQSSLPGGFLEQQSEFTAKNKKMEPSEILAFLKSDAFAEQAVGYMKAVAASNISNDSDTGGDLPGVFFSADASKSENANAEVAKSEASGDPAANEPGIGTDKQSGKAFVNGKLATEKELKAEIVKIEQEVKELTVAYEQIMGGEGGLEEKIRMSQPIHKRLDERLNDLQALKAQVQSLAEAKTRETLASK